MVNVAAAASFSLTFGLNEPPESAAFLGHVDVGRKGDCAHWSFPAPFLGSNHKLMFDLVDLVQMLALSVSESAA